MPRKVKLHIPRMNNRVGRSPPACKVVDLTEDHVCHASCSGECARLNGGSESLQEKENGTTTTSPEANTMEKAKVNGVAKTQKTPHQTASAAAAAATTTTTKAQPASDQSAFTSICINYELGPGHQASVEEHLQEYIVKHPDLALSEAELRAQVEAGVMALKFFRAKYGQDKYGEFIEVMEDFQSKRLDHDGVRKKLLAKFGADEELFRCVNLFFPPSKKFLPPTTATTSTSSSNKQTQTNSASSSVAEGVAATGSSSTGKPSVTTMSAKLTIPLDNTVPISGSIPMPMLPVMPPDEQLKPVYDPEKVSNILLFLGQVKGYSEALFSATLEVFYHNQNMEIRTKPFLYLRVYEQLMALYADHPTLKQAYRHYFGPVNVISGADGSVSIQLPVMQPPPPVLQRSSSLDSLTLPSQSTFCTKCSKQIDSPHHAHEHSSDSQATPALSTTKADKSAKVENANTTESSNDDVEQIGKAMQKKLHITKGIKKNKK